jgi:hypothetical protein
MQRLKSLGLWLVVTAMKRMVSIRLTGPQRSRSQA